MGKEKEICKSFMKLAGFFLMKDSSGERNPISGASCWIKIAGPN